MTLKHGNASMRRVGHKADGQPSKSIEFTEQFAARGLHGAIITFAGRHRSCTALSKHNHFNYFKI